MDTAVKVKTFTDLLSDFNRVIEEKDGKKPPLTAIEPILKDIKANATHNPTLNLRQKEAIIARVDNYLNGTYGKKDQEFKAHKQS